MNKLVSKNPIQRFKLGNRIIKAQNGLKTYKGQTVILSPSGSGMFMGYDPSTKKYNANIQVTAAELDTKVGRGNSKGKIYKGYDGYWYQNGRKLQSSKLYGSNPEIKQKQTVRKPTAVSKPIIVTKPAVVTSRAATGYTLPEGVTDVAAIQRQLKEGNYYNQNYVNSGVKIDDGIWGKETQAAWEAYQNKLAADAGGTTGTTSNVTSTPTSTGATVSGNGYRFTLPTNTNANTNTYESYYPGTYSNLNNMFTRKGIRSNRGTNYSNVNEYWDWLQNNKDSEDYKVWSNIMGNDGYLNKEIFDNVMSQYGIRGNLGRRDSGRLSNLLNDLNLIGVQGRDKNGNIVMSDARKAFLTNFNRNLPNSEEINEYVRTNTPARPNLSTINWGLYPNTISSGNLFTNIDKSEYPHLFAKNGGLISKNPIKRFKSNFR